MSYPVVVSNILTLSGVETGFRFSLSSDYLTVTTGTGWEALVTNDYLGFGQLDTPSVDGHGVPDHMTFSWKPMAYIKI